MTDEPEPNWLTPQQLAAWMPFSAVLLGLPGALDAQLQRDDGISFFGYLVLAGLYDAPEQTLSMSELASFASGSLSRLSHTVSRLESKGWVRRGTLATDGRVTVATLTPAGEAKLASAAPGHVATVRRLVIDAMDPEELTGLGLASRSIMTQLFGPKWPRSRAEFAGPPPATETPNSETRAAETASSEAASSGTPAAEAPAREA